ncbi:hypothetical protein [Polaribacter sp. SA4-12]|uniref:hypothetical protein n=1 Tax=Polaribacter sp. SA4-12 TaxID=1312072 RepID=UPI000B3C94DA|nr:hypothetical protein [Polaribacter sp. SA4-12]ARV16644.1 hypothetical protein BTO07_16530 [Polaribacter sp. SA4-12]
MHLNITEITIIALFSFWLISTALYQFNTSFLDKVDIFGLLPSFRFFAPRPVSRDLRVYCKGYTLNREATNWIPVLKSTKNYWCFIWNPDHRLRKSIFDLYEELDPFRKTPDIWHLTLPYLIFLNAAESTLKSKPGIDQIQFTVACFAGFEDSTHDLLFISNLHKCD